MEDKFYEMAKNAILSDIETRNIQEFLDRMQINKSNEKALADFRTLSAFDKYKECVRYGNTITSTSMSTTDGFLTFKTFEIYGTKFIFVLVSGQVTNCYELQ